MRTTTMSVAAICVAGSAVLAMQTSVPFINADDVHAQGITGLGVTVAVIDTGVYYDHPGIAGSIETGGISIINGARIPDLGEDIYGFGHGTYMSLIITDAGGVAVAPDARILPVRVFPASGAADPLDVRDAIEYVIERRLTVDPSIRVINLSLGGGFYSCQCDQADSVTQAYQAAISAAANSGIITFAATGNEAACGAISRPACVSSVVRVAADYDKAYPSQNYDICYDYAPPAYWVTCFSNHAQDCNYLVAAPGFSITVGGFAGHGTSQATAHASGVAALMFDKSGPCGTLDPWTARTLMFNTATQKWWAFPWCDLPDPPRHINALAAVVAVAAGSCGTVAGDMDCDDTLTGADFAYFAPCMNGPGGEPIGGGCVCADFPESPPDGDIDLRDFIHFQRTLSGSGTTGTVTLDLTSPNAGQTVQPGETVYWSITATVSAGDNAGLAALSVDLVHDEANLPYLDLPAATTIGTGMEGFAFPDGISNPATAVPGSGYGGTPVGSEGAKSLLQIGGAQNTFGIAAGAGADFIVDAAIGQSGPQVIAEGSFIAPVSAGLYFFRIENGLANVLNPADPPPSPPDMWPVSGADVILNTSSFSVTVARPPFVPLDLDDDGDVDQHDFALMQICYSGTLPADPECGDEDVNADGVVDAMDVELISQCGSGPVVPPDPLCGDANNNGFHDSRETEAQHGENPPDGILVLGRPKCTGGQTTGCDDNCPTVYNPLQEDSNGDGVGDACTPPPAPPPPPPDADEDGVPDAEDNCPLVANPEQTDTDADTVGDACDACAGYDDRLDMDGDGIPDDCDNDRDGDGYANAVDNCPDDHNPSQIDMDDDDVGDSCDDDIDADGIVEDSDEDGIKWEWETLCIGGNYVDCDDNCPFDWNPEQEDWDSDGQGNACDPTPGEEPLGGEGMLLGGGLEMMSVSESVATLTEGVTAYFVMHDTGASGVDLPATGGTITVDLLIANGVPITAWEGRPAYRAAGGTPAPRGPVVAVDAEDWTAKADLLSWFGLSQETPASRYDCGANWWAVLNPQGAIVCHSWIKDAHGIERLADAGMTAWLGSYDLDAIDGPLATPAGDGFASATPIGGLTARTLEPGFARVATLTLNVAGQPGTYHLTVTDGLYIDDSPMPAQLPMAAGPAFEIRVASE